MTIVNKTTANQRMKYIHVSLFHLQKLLDTLGAVQICVLLYA